MGKVVFFFTVLLIIIWLLEWLGFHLLELGGLIIILLSFTVVLAIIRLIQGHDI